MSRTRFYLIVEKPAMREGRTYNHIALVREFVDSEWPSEKAMRQKFMALCRKECPADYKDPTRRIMVD